MTCGNGTVSIPKSYAFENFLRMNFAPEQFDKILYYDSCIIARSNKVNGKIIITDNYIYSHTDNSKLISLLCDFKDIISFDLLNDIPEFIIGPMRDDCIHLKIIFYNYKKIVKNNLKDKSNFTSPICCGSTVGSESSEPLLKSFNGNSNENNLLSSEKSVDTKHEELWQNKANSQSSSVTPSADFVDFYILNKYSPIMTVLKKAYADYLIRHTLHWSTSSTNRNLRLTQKLINNLFDGLIFDISRTTNSINVHRDFMLELIQSGYKYARIRILFWSKPTLFDLLVDQFCEKSSIFFSLDSSSSASSSCHSRFSSESQTKTAECKKELIKSSLDCLNVLLQVFNIFLSQTDHLRSKWQHLRKNSSKLSISLLQNMFRVIWHFNRHDRLHSPDPDQFCQNINVTIDEIKYEITLNSIRLFYYMISSSQVPFNEEDGEMFTILTIVGLIESLVSYSSDDEDLVGDSGQEREGNERDQNRRKTENRENGNKEKYPTERKEGREPVFNGFLNQALRMILIWLFPERYKVPNERQLSPDHIVIIFQFFTSLRTVVLSMPKMMEILRKEMQEEFSYFSLNEISFSDKYRLSRPTWKLLKVFQKNMTGSSEIFID